MARRAAAVLAVLAVLVAFAVAVAPAQASQASRLAHNRQVAVHWCALLRPTSRFAVYTKGVTRLLVAETCE